MMTLDEKWDMLREYGISEQTLKVVTSINGYSEETLKDILYVATGYREFEDLETVLEQGQVKNLP